MIKLKVNIRASDNLPTILEVQFFNEVNVNLKFDSVASTYRLQMYFDPNSKLQAELATVTHMHECSLFYVHDQPGTFKNEQGNFVTTTDQLLLTGYMLSQLFHDSEKDSFMEIGGYSKSGVLQDCDIPSSAYPLEFEGMTFRQIITKILSAFKKPNHEPAIKFMVKSSRADQVVSFNYQNDETADREIKKTTAIESKNILSFFKEIALQINVILSHDIFGNLIIDLPYDGNDYLFTIGTGRSTDIKYRSMTLNYNGQGFHSVIEGFRQPDKDGGNLAYFSIDNPLVPIVYRPKVITITQGDDITVAAAVFSERGAELKNLPLKIVLDSPVVNGKFITPNNTILVKNRKCYLYEPCVWLIEEVNYVENEKGISVELTCVLTGAYRGPVINTFIDPHKNVPRV